MDIERETVVEIAVSVGAVGLFVLLIVAVGISYGIDTPGGFSNTGALALVGAILLFVLVMAGVGVALDRQ